MTTNKTFTKPELDSKIVSNLESIIEKFRGKNESYGDQADGLYNFRETAIEFREIFGEDLLEAQFQVAMVLFHKHFVTLKKNGLRDPEFKDRMGDWIAYGAIMMAMGDLLVQGAGEKMEEEEEAIEALRSGVIKAVGCKEYPDQDYLFYEDGEIKTAVKDNNGKIFVWHGIHYAGFNFFEYTGELFHEKIQ